MLLAFALVASVLFLIIGLIGFAHAVQHPLDLGKFSYNKQKLVLCAINVTFAICILVSYLINPESEKTIVILLICQLVVGFMYETVLSVICRKQYYRNLVSEIERLDLDVNEDIAELRRKLMADSDLSCSIKDLEKAISLMTKE